MMPNPSKARTVVTTIMIVVGCFIFAFASWIVFRLTIEARTQRKVDLAFQLPSAFDLASLPTAKRFDSPLGSEHGALTYNAQPFTQNRHLGDDLNGIGGENSDLGDPVYAVADGRVILSQEGGPGWGNVIIVLHAYLESGARKFVQSYYAHVEERLVRPGDEVLRGQKIATVGTANGKYLAHLHFEMREFITPFVGPGYREETRGWLNPGEFIAAHRNALDDDVGRPAF